MLVIANRVARKLVAMLSCHHPAEQRSLPWSDPKLGMYRVCLACGLRISYQMPKAITDHPYLKEQPEVL